MALEIVQVPMLSDNYAYVLHCRDEDRTAVIDPAVAEPVEAVLAERGWRLDWILNTHHHGDHTGGNLALKERTGAKVAGARADAQRIPGMDEPLEDGDAFMLDGSSAQVIATPGHTSGHVSFWFPEDAALFCGDTLFALGCGRLFEGTAAQMWGSLDRLRRLPGGTGVYCAHEYTGANARFALTVERDNQALKARAEEIRRRDEALEPTVPSRLDEERATNPFLRADQPDLKAALGMPEASAVDVFTEVRARRDRFQ